MKKKIETTITIKLTHTLDADIHPSEIQNEMYNVFKRFTKDTTLLHKHYSHILNSHKRITDCKSKTIESSDSIDFITQN